MKAQPAPASVLCLCLVLAACAASAAGGLGKGQTKTLSSGFPQLLSPPGAGPVPSARGGRERRALEVRGALRGLRCGGSVLAEAVLRGSRGSSPSVPLCRVPRACPASAGLLAADEWPFPPPSAPLALRDRSSPRSWLAPAPV